MRKPICQIRGFLIKHAKWLLSWSEAREWRHDSDKQTEMADDFLNTF